MHFVKSTGNITLVEINDVVLRQKVPYRHVSSVFPALFILFLENASGPSLLVGLYYKSDLYHFRRADCAP